MSKKTGFHIEEKSLRALTAKLRKMPTQYIDVTAAVMYNESVDVMRLSHTRVPYEMGDLANSAFVEAPSYGNGTVQMEIGYTGEYAVRQHEDLTYNHPGINSKNPFMGAQGQAKYLESAVTESESKIKTAIRNAINKFLKNGMMPSIQNNPFKSSRDS